MNMTYSLQVTGSVRELGGKFLLIVYPRNLSPYALEINESFARMFRWAQTRKSFQETELSDFLVSEYGISPQYAHSEAHSTIALWQENNLIETL